MQQSCKFVIVTTLDHQYFDTLWLIASNELNNIWMNPTNLSYFSKWKLLDSPAQCNDCFFWDVFGNIFQVSKVGGPWLASWPEYIQSFFWPCNTSIAFAIRANSFFIGPKIIALPKMLDGFFYVVTFSCRNWIMDLSQLLYGFVKIDKWISLTCWIDL